MRKVTQGDIGIRSAIDKNYTSDEEGNIYNPQGIKINCYEGGRGGYLGFKVRGELPDGRSKQMHVRVHRFIAFQKFGERLFTDGLLVRHLDGNPKNNSWKNLELGTLSDNYYDISAEQRKVMHAKIGKSRMKYSDEFINSVRMRYINNCPSSEELMQEFNIPSRSLLSDVLFHDYHIPSLLKISDTERQKYRAFRCGIINQKKRKYSHDFVKSIFADRSNGRSMSDIAIKHGLKTADIVRGILRRYEEDGTWKKNP